MKKSMMAVLALVFIGVSGLAYTAQEHHEGAGGQPHFGQQEQRGGLFGRIRRRLGWRPERQGAASQMSHQMRSGQIIQQQVGANSVLGSVVVNTRSIRQQLLHNNLTLGALEQIIKKQNRHDPILLDLLDDVARVVVLPTSPTLALSMTTVRRLNVYSDRRTQEQYKRDPFNRLRIPAWFVDLVLNDSNDELCAYEGAIIPPIARLQLTRRTYDPSDDQSIEDAIDTFIKKLVAEAYAFKVLKARCSDFNEQIRIYICGLQRSSMRHKWPEFLARLNSRLRRLYKEERTTRYKFRLCEITPGEMVPGGDKKGIYIYFLNQSLHIVDELLLEPAI